MQGYPDHRGLARGPQANPPAPESKTSRVAAQKADHMTTLYSGLSNTGIEIAGSGVFLPDCRITNEDIYQEMRARGQTSSDQVATDWIQEKTGIRARRRLDASAATSDMCRHAGMDALAACNLPPSEVDCLIIGTNTPDFPLPSTALMLRSSMALERAFVLDLNQYGCCASLFGLFLATHFLQTGLYRNVLVIGADVMSRLSNPFNANSVFFGDAASAFLLRPSREQGTGFIAWDLRGKHTMDLCVPAGGSKRPLTSDDIGTGAHRLYMNGRGVWDLATKGMKESVMNVLTLAHMAPEDVETFIFHQANLRLIQECMSGLKLQAARAHTVIEETGNTSTASLGLAYHSALRSGKIHPGENLVFAAAGAGFFWGAALYKNAA
jgi:3-oxoacyl-[acyl-carrier-protein] synthase-3